MNTNFKTALFGGFDREDVVSYIQQTSRENQQRVSALEEENHGLQERNRAMEAELNTLRRAVLDGDTETGSLMAGQVSGMLHEIRPLRTIFEALESGYRAELAQLAAAGV